VATSTWTRRLVQRSQVSLTNSNNGVSPSHNRRNDAMIQMLYDFLVYRRARFLSEDNPTIRRPLLSVLVSVVPQISVNNVGVERARLITQQPHLACWILSIANRHFLTLGLEPARLAGALDWY
jgi:hypothetical protein